MTQDYNKRFDDQDDELILLTSTGRVISDTDMFLDIGTNLIRSKKMDVSMRAVEAIPVLEFMWENHPPVQTGTAHAFDADPPGFGNDAVIMNEMLPEVESQTRSGQWKDGGFFQKAVGSARYWVMALAVGLAGLSTILGNQCAPPDSVIRETNPETGETQVIRLIDVPSLKR